MLIFRIFQHCHRSKLLPTLHKSHKWRLFSSASSNSDDKTFKFDEIPADRIRNFSILAHVDHGKSTLADRMLEMTNTLKVSDTGKSQILDSLQVERERGITVKAQSASLLYNYKGETYLLNLIDTPGHVDFSNEVSRSLAACDGIILLVDANSGVQAQTVANYYLAAGKNLKVLPVMNKIDLKNADPEAVEKQLETIFDIDPKEVVRISAKMGTNVDKVLEKIIETIPHPNVDRQGKTRALLFDSRYDKYRGAMNLMYLKDGTLEVGQEITSCHSGKTYEIKSISLLRPDEFPVKKLIAGQIGLIGCNMRSIKEAHIGDTYHIKNASVEPLPGFKPINPIVFAGVYPTDQSHYTQLRSAIEKLILNDSCVTLVPDSSPALGQGWRLGFLGLLHLEVFSQRLEQEHNAEALLTAPSVTYRFKLKGTKIIKQHGAEIIEVSNPALMPDPLHIEESYEPMVYGTIISPVEHVGDLISILMERRGVEQSSSNIDNDRVMLTYKLPLNEIILDFHDILKSMTSGYASFDYQDAGYELTHLVKLCILLNGQEVNELSQIVHFSKATAHAKQMVAKLKEEIPRQQIHIAIQACVGSKILARENIKPFRKDVTQKVKSGGDMERKRKLLRAQAEGKKKMRSIANINVPRETFINVLKRN
ncbi:translation factor GUF1 homolog, mitochondrial [Culicoides brevitarsis]|uniref:translation factor GUF1 homolog, mitochondrial n=1 Tax=Culicoides brevitarsis TaxID=469753 RepID=UPI00307C288D